MMTPTDRSLLMLATAHDRPKMDRMVMTASATLRTATHLNSLLSRRVSPWKGGHVRKHHV
jgi:hypothetical protein